jgi:hypothetical protein
VPCSRCRQQLKPSVDMTSGVKGCLFRESVDGTFHGLSPDHRKRGSQSSRRLLRLISVGWVPPDWRPSGAGLGLGPRVCCRRLTRTRMIPHRGGASSIDIGILVSLFRKARARWCVEAGRGTSWVMAHMKALSSRAMATTTCLACFPVRSVCGRVDTAARGLSTEDPGWMWAAVPDAVGDDGCLWPGSGRPRRLRSAPAGLGYGPLG